MRRPSVPHRCLKDPSMLLQYCDAVCKDPSGIGCASLNQLKEVTLTDGLGLFSFGEFDKKRGLFGNL